MNAKQRIKEILEEDLMKGSCKGQCGTLQCYKCDILSQRIYNEIFPNGERPKIKNFLFVEDGSVDYDALADDLFETNPEIKVVVYKQGSEKPQLVEVEE